MRWFLFLPLLLLLCIALPIQFPAQAKNQAHNHPDFATFGAWPVLHDGRIKTMESFSRSVFHAITGEVTLRGITATEWMANTVFDPAESIAQPFIFVRPNHTLDLPTRADHFYTMNEVMTALNPYQDVIPVLEQRDPNRLSADQKELLTVYHAVSLYNQIIQSFSAVLPLQGHDKTYLEGSGSAGQRALIAEGGATNNLLKFIPSDNPSTPMISLWHALNIGVETPLQGDLQIMARAWNESDYATWNDMAHEVKSDLYDRHCEEPSATTQSIASWIAALPLVARNDACVLSTLPLALEHYYVTLQPMLWVIGFYILGAGMLCFPRARGIGQSTLMLGSLIHLGALIVRSIILSRPPTGTLYETLLFGAAIVMIVGLCLRKNYLFLMICAMSAAFLLFISRGFIQGDSLNVLVAVLNTNFWLSTHVTCIIIGYAFCVMAAMIGHGVLAVNHHGLEKLMVPMTLAALLFTSVGTLLGGIWADQSWGRFWGWDPKENGALLIVLWLAWILHGRISGHFKKRGFAAMLALTNIMVALTWFGVNLLGVGLHSYGFIDGIAWGLGSFIIIQIAVVTVLYLRHPKMVETA